VALQGRLEGGAVDRARFDPRMARAALAAMHGDDRSLGAPAIKSVGPSGAVVACSRTRSDAAESPGAPPMPHPAAPTAQSALHNRVAANVGEGIRDIEELRSDSGVILIFRRARMSGSLGLKLWT